MASDSATEARVPAIEELITEFAASLVVAAHAYLEPGAEQQPDIASADIAIDLAGRSFERVQERLRPEQRIAFGNMLTEIRLAFVRKRGS